MSKGPDLSAFPIPRKGGARPISMDKEPEDVATPPERDGEGALSTPASARTSQSRSAAAKPDPEPPSKLRTLPKIVQQQPLTVVSGQVVATTVKLDENRYLRLVNAGQPGPGRLKRRTIQEMMVEAIDEWFERRGL